MKVLYGGFDLTDPSTSVSMTINGPAPTILAMFLNTAIDQNIERFEAENGRPPTDEEIVRVMIRMAHAMGLKVICEGCETVEQLRFLQAHECDYVQGYLFSKPQPAEDIISMIRGEQDGSYNIMDVAC